MNTRHIISLLMENEAGALSRVVGLFSARGYNIDALSVAPTEDATLSRLTIVTHGDDDVIEQITKQLNKLIEVVKVTDLNNSRFVERELMLIKVRASVGRERDEICRLVDIYRGSVVDISSKTCTVELTGTSGKLDSFIENLPKDSILETVRTGATGIGRGERMLRI
ncbi:MAG: acetolactate synthase small subunit [Neisseriaceae bacterium]|nr:acetolactate synthase small subunit [Neisseriaceae bacterium]